MFARNPFELILIEIFSGFVMSGFGLATSNFIYDAVSAPKRVRCLAYYNLINGAAIFAGASLGGYLAERLPPLLGYRIVTLFLLSGIVRLFADLFLSRHFTEVRESAKKVSSMQLFQSVLGMRPLTGENTEMDVYPDIRPPREKRS
jgi:MFS family permease